MKSFAGLILVVALVEFASAVTKEYNDLAVAAKDKCVKKHNADESEVMAFIKKKELPQSQEGKCMMTCYWEEMKLIVDGKVDVEEWKRSNKHRWDKKEDQDMADKMGEECAKEVTPGEDKCEYGYKLTECAFKKAKQLGLPEPTFEHPERR